MNAGATSGEQLGEDSSGSDSDTNPDESLEYYQPISAVDTNLDSSDEDSETDHQLPNGYPPVDYRVNSVRVASLALSDDEDVDRKDELEERLRESEIERTMREDEMRRNASLTAENAGRVIEAMRGISFVGPPPSWAGQVGDDQWINQLRTRLRERAPPSAAGHP